MKLAALLFLTFGFAAWANAEDDAMRQFNAAWDQCLNSSMKSAKRYGAPNVETAERALAGCQSEEQLFNAHSLQRGVSPTLVAAIRVRKKQALVAGQEVRYRAPQ